MKIHKTCLFDLWFRPKGPACIPKCRQIPNLTLNKKLPFFFYWLHVSKISRKIRVFIASIVSLISKCFFTNFSIWIWCQMWGNSKLSIYSRFKKVHASFLKLRVVWFKKDLCKGPFLYYVRVFWGFFEPPTHLRKDILLHKVRKNCHFLDHPPTPMSLRNIKMAPNESKNLLSEKNS